MCANLPYYITSPILMRLLEEKLPVEQITVAGNFYELLNAVRELASDLTFPMGGIGCPSVDVGELSVSGT